MMTYEDVVEALEAELGWDVDDVAIVTGPGTCALCGESYHTRLYLRVVRRIDDGLVRVDICPDRIACRGREDINHQAVVNAVTLLPDDDLDGREHPAAVKADEEAYDTLITARDADTMCETVCQSACESELQAEDIDVKGDE